MCLLFGSYGLIDATALPGQLAPCCLLKPPSSLPASVFCLFAVFALPDIAS